ncbi:hypothetical protein ABK040_014157 [Willaertia magna]
MKKNSKKNNVIEKDAEEKTTKVCPLCRIIHKTCLTIKCGTGEKFLELGLPEPWVVRGNKELCQLFKQHKGDPSLRKQFKVIIEERMKEMYELCLILKKKESPPTFRKIYFHILDEFYDDLISEVKIMEKFEEIEEQEPLKLFPNKKAKVNLLELLDREFPSNVNIDPNLTKKRKLLEENNAELQDNLT